MSNPYNVDPIAQGAEDALEAATRPDPDLAALLAAVADPEAAVPNEPAPTPEELAASQALRVLAATPVEQEKPADLEGVMSPKSAPEAILVAALALEAQGDLCSARDLRNGERDQSLLLRAESALQSYNRNVIPAFLEEVS